MINSVALTDKPTLIGDRIRLVPLTLRHAEPMWRSTMDPETRRLTGTVREFTLDDVETWCAGRCEQDNRLDLAVEDLASGAFLGELALIELDERAQSASFRIALAPGAPGRGYGTEAARLMLRYAFEEVRLHRVQLEVFEYNPRAVRAYEKAGFQHEGRSRQALVWEGERFDVLHMAALRPEWRAEGC
ncbi:MULTISPECIES: GNAT family N-acetyltransferase [Kitasatospora]|uniref:RimJ/RimL family protein N-acetyltransferase n=2 Tax=Kitasatospora TaxID=2063 RepID=A0ABT1IY89_9ACTN|nr:GNAT family protein [Kitasatospora paracochleata]MCP2310125.1 RimJ/RimL family protein N-acetyltransferase [Kitasatospora paracochleata]